MIRDITIGQYYPADSILHRLDPRVKISCTLLYLISLFLFKSVLGYVIAGIYGNPSCIFNRRFYDHDIDNNAKCVDRRD